MSTVILERSGRSLDLHGPSTADGQLLWAGLMKFVGWLERAGCASYDPYDIWGTRYGLWSRRLYYARHLWGVPFITPILLLEIFCPGLRRFVVQKQRFATADAQVLLGFLNLYQATGQGTFLARARVLAQDLLRTSLPGFSGHCWGYPFDWQNDRGLWARNTPFITATPYAYEAFARLHEVTGDPALAAVAESAARFVHDDLNDTPTSARAAAASYSPFTRDRVVNASAYRAFVLFDAAARFHCDVWRRKASRNLNFILESQRQDGSWLYAVEEQGAPSFIDHFHTCFVLKNLHKINRHLQDPEVARAIRVGYAYYRGALFYDDDSPKSFALQPRTQLVRLEMYDLAESITLGALLRQEIPGAIDLAWKLARRLVEGWQLADGHFVTRVYRGGRRHSCPFLRWPQAQLFYALTNLWAALGAAAEPGETPDPSRK